MTLGKYRILIGILLGIAAAVSAYILAVDAFLWEVNSTNGHAYGLILFLVGDVVLAIILFIRFKLGAFLTMGWGVAQIALIIGDIMSALGLSSLGLDTTFAFEYLILGKGNESGFATDALIAIYALVFFFSLVAYLRLRKEPAEIVAAPPDVPEVTDEQID